ncbi:NUDIX hydrolase [Piscinibacter sakaiensis]|uniref:NUDIX hydrolase n=1 Tax=Piscinibacter sakaiensis TaxID=1547922 RepID=UPI003AAAC201
MQPLTKPGIVGQTGAPPAAQGLWNCDDALRQLLQQRLDAYAPGLAALPDGPELRRAAVALAVTESGLGADLPGLPTHSNWSTAAALILTRRSGSLRSHGGQWALPGGRVDGDETAEQAALRELAEEIDLQLGPDAVLGRLDDYATRSGYLITPVVVWAGSAERLQLNPAEVQSIHRIGFGEWLRADSPMLEASRHGPHPVLRMPVGGSWIAAPTAALLYQFREVCLLDRPTRVAHFDQPDFAWR